MAMALGPRGIPTSRSPPGAEQVCDGWGCGTDGTGHKQLVAVVRWIGVLFNAVSGCRC